MTRDPIGLTLDYLQRHRVITLATCGTDGVWSAAVFYANDGFELYFLSAAHTRHSTHIARNPRVAGAIHENYENWRSIQGIQLEGVARVLEGEARTTAITIYRNKHSFIDESAELQEALARVNWYALIPDKLYFIDNSQRLGYRERVI